MVNIGVRDLGKYSHVPDVEPVAKTLQSSTVVFLAIPHAEVHDWVEVHRMLLKNKLIVDCTNAVKWDKGPIWHPPKEGSMSAMIQAMIPDAKVVKAFNTFGSEFVGSSTLKSGTSVDLFMAGNDAGGKSQVAFIAQKMGYRPVDSGPLRNAAVLENVAVLWIHLATIGGHGRDFVLNMAKNDEAP